MQQGIILGLTAAFCWGTADFLVRGTARRIGTYRTLLYVQFLGFFALGAYLLFSGSLAHLIGTAGHAAWLWALLAALLDLVATLALYRALEIGVVSIVSPIVASYAALTAVLSVLSGEVLTVPEAVGMLAALIGVALTAGLLLRYTSANLPVTALAPAADVSRGVFWAMLSAVTYGVTFWVLGFHVTPALGGIAPVWIIRLVVIAMLTAFAAPLGQSIRPAVPAGWAMIALIGVLDTGGLVAVAKGAHGDQTAIVGVLSSLFSAVTVLLAWIFIRERLARSQWIGIAGILAGVALISA